MDLATLMSVSQNQYQPNANFQPTQGKHAFGPALGHQNKVAALHSQRWWKWLRRKNQFKFFLVFLMPFNKNFHFIGQKNFLWNTVCAPSKIINYISCVQKIYFSSSFVILLKWKFFLTYELIFKKNPADM